MVLFDAEGERLRPAPLEVKEGAVRSVAFGPAGQIAAGYGDSDVSGVVLFDARGERLQPAPLEVEEGPVSSVAFGSEGHIAAGYGIRGRLGPFSSAPSSASAAWCSSTRVGRGSEPRRWRSRRARSGAWPSGRRARSPRDMASSAAAGWCSSTPRGERLGPAPLEVKEGEVRSVAFGPAGKIAAGYGVDDVGGVVLFDARGERLRPTPLEVKEGAVSSVAFGPAGQIAAGYGDSDVGGVVLFDTRGERLRAAPLEVKEGSVSSVAFGPEGQIAAGYGVYGRSFGGDLLGGGGVMLFDARGERLRPAPLGGQGGLSRAWPSGPPARSPRDMASTAAAAAYRRRGGGVVLFDARGERLRAAPLEVQEGDVWSVAFGPEGKIAAGYGGRGFGGVSGVVLFDGAR